MTERLLALEQVAEQLGIDLIHIENMVRVGVLQAENGFCTEEAVMELEKSLPSENEAHGSMAIDGYACFDIIQKQHIFECTCLDCGYQDALSIEEAYEHECLPGYGRFEGEGYLTNEDENLVQKASEA